MKREKARSIGDLEAVLLGADRTNAESFLEGASELGREKEVVLVIRETGLDVRRPKNITVLRKVTMNIEIIPNGFIVVEGRK